MGDLPPMRFTRKPSGYHSDALLLFSADPTGNQPMEKAAIRCRKKPSKMNMTMDTYCNAPGISREPGEFDRRQPDITAPPGIPKTTDFINNAFRVGEGVGMCTVDLPDLGRGGDLVKASPADDGIPGRFHGPVLIGCRWIRGGLFGSGYRSKQMQATIGIGLYRLNAATYFMMRWHDHQRVENGSEIGRIWFQAPAVACRTSVARQDRLNTKGAGHDDGHNGRGKD